MVKQLPFKQLTRVQFLLGAVIKKLMTYKLEKLGLGLFLAFLAIILVVTSFGFGFYFGMTEKDLAPIKGIINQELGEPEEVDFALFWDVWRIIQKEFPEITPREMLQGAISGMIEKLEDPYTVFLTPEDTKRFIEDIEGIFEGVGMEIGIRDEQLQVIAPLKGTPAYKAGLRSGDKIIKINENKTADLSIIEAVNLIRGPKGTKVTLTILREDEWPTPKQIEIVRGIIEIPSLKWEMLEDNIAHLKIYHFNEKTNRDFPRIAIEILDSDARKIILDLRNNMGGILGIVKDIAGWFLERGDIIVIEDFNGEKRKVKATGNARLLGYPIVVLINQGTASGSEILAAALRDNREVKIIGETSFGKGSVQDFEKLRHGYSLRITIAQWLTPRGELISNIGLEPDIKVEMTIEDFEKGRDPQLDKAIEIIREL